MTHTLRFNVHKIAYKWITFKVMWEKIHFMYAKTLKLIHGIVYVLDSTVDEQVFRSILSHTKI